MTLQILQYKIFIGNFEHNLTPNISANFPSIHLKFVEYLTQVWGFSHIQ